MSIKVKVVGKPDKLLEKVFNQIISEVIERKVEEALKAALQLINTAHMQALASIEKDVEEILRIAEEKLRAHESTLDAKLRIEIAKLKAEYASKAVEEALHRLRNEVPADKYREVLKRMLNEALTSIARYTSDVLIVPTKRDRDLIEEILSEVATGIEGLNATLASEDIEGIGGFIVQSRDGRVRFDYRLEAVLSSAIDKAKARALKELFG